MIVRRRMLAVLSLVAAGTLVSGCSVVQVQVWMSLHGAPSMSAAEARVLADKVNADSSAGCDEYYVGGCVPNDQAVVHCAGTIGEGPVITGPLTVDRWDHFGLDPDCDGIACNGSPPTGAVDTLLENADETGILVQGWTLDPDSDNSIAVHVYDNGVGRAYVASQSRPDLLPFGRGAAHGFSIEWLAAPGTHQVCVYGIDSAGGANTTLGCRSVLVAWKAEMLNSLNRQRSQAGAPALVQCASLSRSAQAHSDEQAASNLMSHAGDGGSSSADRLALAGYRGYSVYGENIASSYPTVAAVMASWTKSALHQANLVNPAFSQVGLGMTFAADGTPYWTQDFGAGGTC
ncbi:hypothetical protein BH10ACT3_BH10ACT3_11630 [soil metagenome]